VKSVLVAAMTALVVSLLGTPAAIKLFRRRGYGQEIREDGPSSHATKRGTPTMGGTVIIAAALIGYGVAHLLVAGQRGRGPTASALLVLALMTGLGLVGFLDDFIKIRKQPASRRPPPTCRSSATTPGSRSAPSASCSSPTSWSADGPTPST